MGNPSGRLVILPQKQILIFLWGMANQEPARTIADRFDITRSSYNRVFWRVVTAAVDLRHEYIKWPTGEYHKCLSKCLPFTGNNLLEISSSFEDEGRFPGVIGIIDGTHVKIRTSESEPEANINCKKFHSLNVQVRSKKENTKGLCHSLPTLNIILFCLSWFVMTCCLLMFLRDGQGLFMTRECFAILCCGTQVPTNSLVILTYWVMGDIHY